MILSIDMSLRSTGVCILDYDDKLVHFEIMKTDAKKFPEDEGVILHLEKSVKLLMTLFPKIEQFVIEGLAMNAKSAKKDVIAGVYWGIRTMMYQCYPGVLIGSVPVTAWRNWTTTKEERADAKRYCSDHLKNAVFRKLPNEVRRKFLLYVEENGWNIKSTFDLADAYWLARYRNDLNRLNRG